MGKLTNHSVKNILDNKPANNKKNMDYSFDSIKFLFDKQLDATTVISVTRVNLKKDKQRFDARFSESKGNLSFAYVDSITAKIIKKGIDDAILCGGYVPKRADELAKLYVETFKAVQSFHSVFNIKHRSLDSFKQTKESLKKQYVDDKNYLTHLAKDAMKDLGLRPTKESIPIYLQQFDSKDLTQAKDDVNKTRKSYKQFAEKMRSFLKGSRSPDKDSITEEKMVDVLSLTISNKLIATKRQSPYTYFIKKKILNVSQDVDLSKEFATALSQTRKKIGDEINSKYQPGKEKSFADIVKSKKKVGYLDPANPYLANALANSGKEKKKNVKVNVDAANAAPTSSPKNESSDEHTVRSETMVNLEGVDDDRDALYPAVVSGLEKLINKGGANDRLVRGNNQEAVTKRRQALSDSGASLEKKVKKAAEFARRIYVEPSESYDDEMSFFDLSKPSISGYTAGKHDTMSSVGSYSSETYDLESIDLAQTQKKPEQIGVAQNITKRNFIWSRYENSYNDPLSLTAEMLPRMYYDEEDLYDNAPGVPTSVPFESATNILDRLTAGASSARSTLKKQESQVKRLEESRNNSGKRTTF